jgi:hypothetical protein
MKIGFIDFQGLKDEKQFHRFPELSKTGISIACKRTGWCCVLRSHTRNKMRRFQPQRKSHIGAI